MKLTHLLLFVAALSLSACKSGAGNSKACEKSLQYIQAATNDYVESFEDVEMTYNLSKGTMTFTISEPNHKHWVVDFDQLDPSKTTHESDDFGVALIMKVKDGDKGIPYYVDGDLDTHTETLYVYIGPDADGPKTVEELNNAIGSCR